MFTFEHKIERPMKTDQVWNYYSDVSLWAKWDPVVKSVEFDGPFEEGQMRGKAAEKRPAASFYH